MPASTVDSDTHFVLVPTLDSICPGVPVAPCASRMPKLKSTSPINVDVARVFVPFANRLPTMVVVASVVVPVVVRLLVVAFVATRLVVNRLLNTAVIAFNIFVIERFDQIVLVPVVDALPDTKLPRSFTRNVEDPTRLNICRAVDVELDPFPKKANFAAVVVEMSVLKEVFSVHADPFQMSADPVATPFASAPDIVTHFVLVPVLDRYCPTVPVAFVLSLSP